jgi:hypothetical protein
LLDALKCPEKQLRDLFALVDVNNNGFLDYFGKEGNG